MRDGRGKSMTGWKTYPAPVTLEMPLRTRLSRAFREILPATPTKYLALFLTYLEENKAPPGLPEEFRSLFQEIIEEYHLEPGSAVTRETVIEIAAGNDVFDYRPRTLA